MKTQDTDNLEKPRTHKRACIFFFSCSLAIYVLTYSILSLGGRYEPSIVGTFGVEQYWWAPVGFYNNKHPAGNLGWNNAMCYAFLPLWWLDNSYVHNDKKTGNNQTINQR
jgi:hypothetical protein